MNKVLKNSWALFLGMGCLMMAYGFQGSLLGVRAVQEEFSLTATGFMMSGYFVGYFIGAKLFQVLFADGGKSYCLFKKQTNSDSIIQFKLQLQVVCAKLKIRERFVLIKYDNL